MLLISFEIKMHRTIKRRSREKILHMSCVHKGINVRAVGWVFDNVDGIKKSRELISHDDHLFRQVCCAHLSSFVMRWAIRLMMLLPYDALVKKGW